MRDWTPGLVRMLWRRKEQLSAVGKRVVGRVGHVVVALPTVPLRYFKMSRDLYKAQILLSVQSPMVPIWPPAVTANKAGNVRIT